MILRRLSSRIALLVIVVSPTLATGQHIPLKYATPGQIVPLPRFLDSLDGDTEETAVTVNASDIKLWKSGASSWVSKNSGGATHSANGL